MGGEMRPCTRCKGSGTQVNDYGYTVHCENCAGTGIYTGDDDDCFEPWELVGSEIAAAAKWWADHLRTNHAPKVDNGARTEEQRIGELLIGLVQSLVKPLSPETADRFERELAAKMISDFSEGWDPSRPLWGAAFRTIGTDYHPDGFLQAAGRAAGIERLDPYLPIKTIMWVNPGKVVVRCGYAAHEEVIYEAPAES